MGASPWGTLGKPRNPEAVEDDDELLPGPEEHPKPQGRPGVMDDLVSFTLLLYQNSDIFTGKMKVSWDFMRFTPLAMSK